MRTNWTAAVVAAGALVLFTAQPAQATTGDHMITASQVGVAGLHDDFAMAVPGNAYPGSCSGNPRGTIGLLKTLHKNGKTSTDVVEFAFSLPTHAAAAAFLARLRSTSHACFTRNARQRAPKAAVVVRTVPAPAVAGISHSLGVLLSVRSTAVDAKTRTTTVNNSVSRLNAYLVGRFVVITTVTKATTTTAGRRTTTVVRDDASTRALGAKVAAVAVNNFLTAAVPS